jgi:hypothetical protein
LLKPIIRRSKEFVRFGEIIVETYRNPQSHDMLWNELLNPEKTAIAASEHPFIRRNRDISRNFITRRVANFMYSEGIPAGTVIGWTCRHIPIVIRLSTQTVPPLWNAPQMPALPPR